MDVFDNSGVSGKVNVIVNSERTGYEKENAARNVGEGAVDGKTDAYAERSDERGDTARVDAEVADEANGNDDFKRDFADVNKRSSDGFGACRSFRFSFRVFLQRKAMNITTRAITILIPVFITQLRMLDQMLFQSIIIHPEISLFNYITHISNSQCKDDEYSIFIKGLTYGQKWGIIEELCGPKRREKWQKFSYPITLHTKDCFALSGRR